MPSTPYTQQKRLAGLSSKEKVVIKQGQYAWPPRELYTSAHARGPAQGAM